MKKIDFSSILNQLEPKKKPLTIPKINIDYLSFEAAMLKIAQIKHYERHMKENFSFSQDQKKLLSYLHSYITQEEAFPGSFTKGILVIGRFGNGKTFIMSCFARFLQLLTETKILRLSFRFVNVLELQQLLMNQDFDAFDTYKNGIIFLDDIGKDDEKIKVYGTNIAPIRSLLDARYVNNVITFGTSNYRLETLAEKYGKYIGSRLYEMFNIFNFSGKDFRKTV